MRILILIATPVILIMIIAGIKSLSRTYGDFMNTIPSIRRGVDKGFEDEVGGDESSK